MQTIKLILLFIVIVACNQKQQATTISKNKIIKTENKIVFDSIKIDSFFAKFPKLEIVKTDVATFYKNKKFTFIWFNDSKINEQSFVLNNQILNITSDGLPNKTFYINELAELLNSKAELNTNIETELMLTAQYFIYAKKVWSGMSEKETKSINWHLSRKKLDYNKLLDSIVKGNLVLTNPPIYRQYSLLKTELKNYEYIKQNGGFPIIDTSVVNFKIGDSSITIKNLTKWLIISKDLVDSTSNTYYDANLETAIKNIQTRFGLKIDGQIKASLVKEMNVSVDERIQQIALNMERCRWLPTGNKTDYLVINIPEYKMHVYENDSLVWSMNAVVGKPNHKTAIFADKIEFVVFSPFWNVPNSILKKEILPGIARNKNYLVQHRMEWYNGMVRQKPGSENSLGLVKFLFPNSYDIYLHDTPTKSLFDNSNRAYSHGCIRLENAEKLANYLLKDDQNWNTESIKTAMHNMVEKWVKVKKQENVFIVYFTSWVDTKGHLNFRKDIYNRDKKLSTLLLMN